MRIRTTAMIAALTATAAGITGSALLMAPGSSDTDPTPAGTAVMRPDTVRESSAATVRNFAATALADLETPREPTATNTRATPRPPVGAPEPTSGRPSADEREANNTAQTTTGAFLQSHGICGYGRFEFTIDSRRFEYLSFGLSSAGNTVWTNPFPVSQSWVKTLPVDAFTNTAYYVTGWDWTTNGWQATTVLTTFWHVSGNNTLGGC